jgi:hypothetical protein
MIAAAVHKPQTTLMLLEFFIPITVLKHGAGRIGIEFLDGNKFLPGARLTRLLGLLYWRFSDLGVNGSFGW